MDEPKQVGRGNQREWRERYGKGTRGKVDSAGGSDYRCAFRLHMGESNVMKHVLAGGRIGNLSDWKEMLRWLACGKNQSVTRTFGIQSSAHPLQISLLVPSLSSRRHERAVFA